MIEGHIMGFKHKKKREEMGTVVVCVEAGLIFGITVNPLAVCVSVNR